MGPTLVIEFYNKKDSRDEKTDRRRGIEFYNFYSLSFLLRFMEI